MENCNSQSRTVLFLYRKSCQHTRPSLHQRTLPIENMTCKLDTRFILYLFTSITRRYLRHAHTFYKQKVLSFRVSDGGNEFSIYICWFYFGMMTISKGNDFFFQIFQSFNSKTRNWSATNWKQIAKTTKIERFIEKMLFRIKKEINFDSRQFPVKTFNFNHQKSRVISNNVIEIDNAKVKTSPAVFVWPLVSLTMMCFSMTR